jgi:small conductance mechanosensitive channel
MERRGKMDLKTRIIPMIIEYGSQVLLALLVLFLGLILIKFVMKLIHRIFVRSRVDESLRSFLKSLISITLKTLLFISVASILGIKTASFIAILGAAGLAVGLALQGSLANFAGGVLILIFRPFNVGDEIEAEGHHGIVAEIQILYTVVNTFNNQQVIIPNGKLSNNSIVNYSEISTRRMDLKIGVSYDSDFKKVQSVLFDIIRSEPTVLREPAPFVRILEPGDSAVIFFIKLWAKNEDYWDVYYNVMEKILIEFRKHHISIPYPVRDVYIHNPAPEKPAV